MENLERRMHMSELFYDAPMQRSELGQTYHYIHSFKVAASRKVTINEFETAFRALVHYQVRLHTRIEKREGNAAELWYCDMEEKDHSQFKVPMTEENVSSFDEWTRIVDRDGKIGFDRQNGPIWRVVILRISDTNDFGMILSIHHSISDAKSVFDLIYRQFLPILSHIINSQPVPEKFQQPLLPCPTVETCSMPFEEADNMGRNRSFLAALFCHLAEWRFRHITHEDKARVTPLCDKNGTPEDKSTITNMCEMVPYSYSKELTAALTAAAKSHQTTVHAVLLVAASASLVKIMQHDGKPVPRKLSLGWPICKRRMGGLSSPQPLGVVIGNGMGYTPSRTDIQPQQFWQDAVKVTKQVRKYMPEDGVGLSRKDKCVLGIMGQTILKAMERGLSPLSLMMSIVPTVHTGISNLGLCEANGPEPDMSDGHNKLELLENYFGVDGMYDECYGMVSNFMTVNTFRGQLRWNLCVGKEWISRERALELMRETENILKTMCSPNTAKK